MGVGAGVGLDVPQAVLVVLPEDKTLLFGSANSLTGWRQWGHMTPSVARKTARFLSCLMHVLQNLCPQGLRQPFASSSKQMVHISSSSSSTLVNIISSTPKGSITAFEDGSDDEPPPPYGSIEEHAASQADDESAPRLPLLPCDRPMLPPPMGSRKSPALLI